ncbi:MAG: histidine kinase [Reichenbachiella sp.]|uniref:sensor histidine kinase n=1 Tax=Reichenbachiella sp. TaxID=2184521 RepID=UPI002965E8B9|nr:histidine kinase [Reichenbachiella sp.]MDW3208424.1 histidine kinase [Reichenbachiella sp.]
MIEFLKKYKAFGIGLIIVPFFYILDYLGVIILPSEMNTDDIFIFAIWWLLLSLVIHNFSFFIQKKKTMLRLFGLLILFVLVLLYDSNKSIPDNPITICFLLIFYLGLAFTLFPGFFKKYQYYILGAYTLISIHFTYLRLSAPNFEYYVEHDKTFALLLFLVPIPVLIILFFYEQWKWLKTLEADKSQAELELLKTQVNPHFFFNTLNNLYSLTVKHSDEAPKVILKLSEMMRYSIYEGKKDWVPLKDEVIYLQNYLDLHQIRYRKKVDISFNHHIDENDQVAPLLFIILLENALKHGVESLSDNAYIRIDLSSANGHLKFSLQNNFDPAEVSEASGIGLNNLKQRLKLIYPNKHTLSILAKDDVFRVELTVEHND